MDDTMNQLPVEIEPRVVRIGLKRAMLRSRESQLCVLGPTSIRFIGISDPRMMVSWEHPAVGPITPCFHVFPTFVIRLLTSTLGQELTRLSLGTVGQETVLELADKNGQYALHWPSDLRQFLAPPEFAYMLAVPKDMLALRYLSLSDAAHQAIANLVNLQAMQNIPSEKLAILVDFSASHLMLAGRTIVHGTSGAYYFDPRLLIRALELIKSNTVRVGMVPLPLKHRAVLTILADQDGWRVQCALLSIGMDTQKLYPLPEQVVAGRR
jgi:hypothetical protein